MNISQKGLIQHYELKYSNAIRDFRSSSLSQLVRRYIQGPEILDAGCGSGEITFNYIQKGSSIVGIDPDEKMISMAVELHTTYKIPEISFVQSDIVTHAKMNENKYDSVVCLDVIEHIEDDEQAFGSLANMLTKAGRLILTVPSIPRLFGPKDIAVGHYRRYSKKELKRLSDRAGLQIITLRYWNLLGVVPTAINSLLLDRRVSEDFRYRQDTISTLKNMLLRKWFTCVENNISPPVGLTLFLVAEK